MDGSSGVSQGRIGWWWGLLLLGADLICVPLRDIPGGCLRGGERPKRVGGCIRLGPAGKMGSIWDISHRGDLMQRIGYRGVGRKGSGSQRELVGRWGEAEERRGNTQRQGGCQSRWTGTCTWAQAVLLEWLGRCGHHLPGGWNQEHSIHCCYGNCGPAPELPPTSGKTSRELSSFSHLLISHQRLPLAELNQMAGEFVKCSPGLQAPAVKRNR